MPLKDLNAVFTFVYAAETAYLLFRPNCYQKKCVDQLSIEKSFKDSEKNDFSYTMKFPPYRQNRRLSTE